MKFDIKEEGKFKYVEEGEGPVLLFLHGLFGALSNYQYQVEAFKDKYKVVIPILPIFELPLHRATLSGLSNYVKKFVAYKGYRDMTVIGNSLGGHITLMYTLEEPQKVKAIVLTGSSGLFEQSLGDTFPKRGDYQFIKERTEYTFYDPKSASKELVDEVFEIVNNRSKAIRVISTAKSAIRNNLAKKLGKIIQPALLIWGADDRITPPFVGEQFKELLPNGELHIIDKCGHAPMMERPGEFNALLAQFLEKVYQRS